VVFLLLKFAVKDFVEDREYKNLSKNTIDTYSLTLKEFQSHCSHAGIVDVSEITGGTVKSYLVFLQKEKGNNPTTRNTKLRTLKAFFNYLESNDVFIKTLNPIKKLSYAKEEIKIEAFKDHHILQMLGYFRKLKKRQQTFCAYRNYSIIVFLLGSGCRLGELINLKWNDVDLINGVLSVWGKMREVSSIPITDKLLKEMLEYLIFCEKHFGTLSEQVFTTDDNKKLSPNAVKCMFKKLQKIMNFKDVRLSCHTFRHSFAHRMCMNGADVFTLQKMLRHSELEMTSRYISMWGTALKDQNNKYNPLNNIDV
jgi:integrase/recombinase XerD